MNVYLTSDIKCLRDLLQMSKTFKKKKHLADENIHQINVSKMYVCYQQALVSLTC